MTVTPCRLLASLVTVKPPAVPACANPLAAIGVLAIGIRAGGLYLGGRLGGYSLPSPFDGKGLAAVL